ncbi:MAG: AraC family transcriptional regulator [Bacteroidales bacterium]|nr:AraC family transcriptional regulator [Bacteroidales bacterium]
MDAGSFDQAAELSRSMWPVVGFVYLTAGDVLIEVEDRSCLCGAGQLLLIPERSSFVILHHSQAVGYLGGFQPSFLKDSSSLHFLGEPLQQAFWFDEGAFAGELFNMLAWRYECGDMAFAEKGMELLLTRVRSLPSMHLPERVSSLLEQLFSETAPLLPASGYAAQMGISLNYLNRMVKLSTGRPLSAWIDAARLDRAKRMLKETDAAMIDVAAAVGYYDQGYFARFFRKHTGMTPSDFRRTMHG